MNILDIDPNPQLSVYSGIKKRLILSIRKLRDCLYRIRDVFIRQQKHSVNLPEAREIPPHDNIPCCQVTSPVGPETQQHLRYPVLPCF